MLVLLMACGGADPFDPSGVWMLQIAASTGAECDTLLSHNLDGASLPSEPIGSEITTTASDEVVMARIALSEVGLLMMIDGGVYPEDDDGERATFSWVRSSTTSETESHAAGYALTVEQEDTLGQAVQIALPRKATDEPGVYEGTWTDVTTTRAAWEESDTWPDEVKVGEVGALPASSYLEVPADDTGGGTMAASNSQWAEDCTEDPCRLQIEVTCTDRRALTATLTDIDPTEEGWQDAGWPAGY